MTNDAVISTEGRNLLRQESLSYLELLSRYVSRVSGTLDNAGQCWTILEHAGKGVTFKECFEKFPRKHLWGKVAGKVRDKVVGKVGGKTERIY